MILTKQDQEAIVQKYVIEKHNTDECIGFVDGILATIKLLNEKRIEQDIMKEALKRIYNESVGNEKYTKVNPRSGN